MKFNYITPPSNFLQVPFRFASTLIVRLIAPTPVTPNQVTCFRGLVVMIGLACMASGRPGTMTVGAVLFYVFEVLDHVDGDLARFTNRKSKLGPLLEQFQDTLFARPANLLGGAIAYGIFVRTGSWAELMCFAFCAYGRMNWMEFRDYFGWHRNIDQPASGYENVLAGKSPREAAEALLKILYIWNNTFILVPALTYDLLPAPVGGRFMLAGFIAVAALNNLPWIAIVAKGFSRALRGESVRN